MKSYNSYADTANRLSEHFDWASGPKDKKAIMLRSLRDTCKDCIMCHLGRENHIRNYEKVDPHVFSNMQISKIMIIGQNPGYNECLKDEPFVGDAGDNFNKGLARYGLSRKDLYITNLLKCLTPDNRKPESDEVKRCQHFLHMELLILRPSIVVSLGASSFEWLCPEHKYGDRLGKLTYSPVIEKKIFAVYHPSPRNLSTRQAQFDKQMKLMCGLIKHFNSAQDYNQSC